jgi:hypothetical protein
MEEDHTKGPALWVIITVVSFPFLLHDIPRCKYGRKMGSGEINYSINHVCHRLDPDLFSLVLFSISHVF